MFGAFLGMCQRIKNQDKGSIPDDAIINVPLTGTGEDFQNDNDFTTSGEEWSSDTLKGSCLTHNETTDYVDGVSLFDISSTWTIALWTKKTNSNMVNQNILSIGDNTTEYIMVSMGDGSSNNVKLEVKGDSTIVSNTLEPIVPNRWYQVLVTGNNGVVTLFIDGSQLYQSTVTFTANTPNITIGNHVSTRTNGMVGKLSTLRAWNNVLTQEEITDLFNHDLYNHPIDIDHDVIAVYPFYKSFDDNWFTKNNLSLTGTVALTDRSANFNGNAGNFLKKILSVPDIHAIRFKITPSNDITNVTVKQQIIGFGASDVGVFIGQSDGSATDETLSIKSSDGDVTYITDTINSSECSEIMFNWNSVELKYDVYFNSIKKTQSNGTNASSLISNGDRISFSESDAYNGKITDVYIYSSSITDEEIDSILIDISTGLQGNYPLENNSFDIENSNNGTDHLVTYNGTYVTGNGYNQYVSIPIPYKGITERTYSFWARVETGGTSGVDRFLVGSDSKDTYSVNNYDWFFSIRDDIGVSYSSLVNSNALDISRWYMFSVIVNHDTGEYSWYQDAVYMGNSTSSIFTKNNKSNNLQVSGFTDFSNSYATESKVANLRVYDRNLKIKDIEHIYNIEKSKFGI